MKRRLVQNAGFGLPIAEITVATIEEELRVVAMMLAAPIATIKWVRHNSADSFGNQGIYSRAGSAEFVTCTYLKG